MPVVSIWISYKEPVASVWLRNSVATLDFWELNRRLFIKLILLGTAVLVLYFNRDIRQVREDVNK
jgi:hypothetical protein